MLTSLLLLRKLDIRNLLALEKEKKNTAAAIFPDVPVMHTYSFCDLGMWCESLAI